MLHWHAARRYAGHDTNTSYTRVLQCSGNAMQSLCDEGYYRGDLYYKDVLATKQE